MHWIYFRELTPFYWFRLEREMEVIKNSFIAGRNKILCFARNKKFTIEIKRRQRKKGFAKIKKTRRKRHGNNPSSSFSFSLLCRMTKNCKLWQARVLWLLEVDTYDFVTFSLFWKIPPRAMAYSSCC